MTTTAGVRYKCLCIHFVFKIPFGMYHSYVDLLNGHIKINYEQEKQKLTVKHEGITIIIINNLQVLDKMGIYNGEPL